MKTEKQSNYRLGLAFLLQFVTSFTAGVLQKSKIVFPGDIPGTFNAVAEYETLFRVTLLLDGFTALGVVFLGSVLYRLLKPWGPVAARTGFALYILEASVHLTGSAQTYSLLGLARDYFSAQGAETQLVLAVQTLSLMEISGFIMMLAFCTGAILFYYLLYKSKIVPVPLSLWGGVSVSLLWIWTVLGILGIQVPFLFYLPYVPFEFVMAIWFFIKGKQTGKMAVN